MFLLRLIQLIRSMIGSQGQKGDETMFTIGKLTRLYLGYVGENESRVISIDMNEWLEKWPDATIVVQVVRPDGYKYFAATEMENGVMTWEVTAGEVLYKGKGFAQITAVDLNTDKEYKSRTVESIIAESLEEFNSLVLAETDPAQKWVNKVLEAAQQAEEAVDKMPYIGENGNWMIWDAEAGAFADSGEKAAGPAGSYNLVDGNAAGSVRSVRAMEDGEELIDGDVYTQGVASMAFGFSSAAAGQASAAMGFGNEAIGTASLATGYSTQAKGYAATSFGTGTIARGDNSLATGVGAEANGADSVALGAHTVANGDQQMAVGRQNEWDEEGKYAFIVGNGSADTVGPAYRSNAFTVDWEGNAHASGKVTGANMDMGESGIYIVTAAWSDADSSFMANRSKSEIVAAAAAGKACLLHLVGMNTDFLHAGNGLFVRAEYDNVNRTNGGTYFCWVTVDEDKLATWQDVGPYANIPAQADTSNGPCLLIDEGGGWEPITLVRLKTLLGIA